MKEELITFDTAKLAKEKGCHLTHYDSMYNQDGNIGSPYKETYPKYSQSLLQRWLREEFGIHVWVQPNLLWQEYSHKGVVDRRNTHKTNLSFDGESMKATYEEALEAGLQEALKLINR